MTRASVLKTILALALIACSSRYYFVHVPEGFVDFRAFYCAGSAVVARADPYREHPLHECEQKIVLPGTSALPKDLTVPAPFPGYVLALFALLALLPFSVAVFVWIALSAIAVGAAVVLFARATRTTIAANAIVLGYPTVMVALPLGQVTPFILLALAGTAALLQSNRPSWAGVAALGALLDPHVGLALWAGMFVGSPRSRSMLIAGAVALFAIGMCVSGPQHEWEYLRFVIPAHAAANIADGHQFSVTHFAFVTGASPTLAILLGMLWYVGALFVGIFVACRLRRRLGIGAIAFVPTAFLVFGGTYTHLQQLEMGVPAFLLLAAAATGVRRELYSACTFVAAMPWLTIACFPWLFVAPLVFSLLFTLELRTARQAIRLGVGSFLILCVILLSIVKWHVEHRIAPPILVGNPLAEVSWQVFTLATYVPLEPWLLVAKAPTLVAFALLLAVLLRTAARRPALVPV